VAGQLFHIHYVNGVQIGHLEASSQVLLLRVLPSTMVVTANPNIAQLGQAIVITATISGSIGGGAPSSGRVSFMDGSAVLGTQPVSNGVASLTVTSLSAGSHSLTAAFGGSSDYAATTSVAVAVQIQSSGGGGGGGGGSGGWTPLPAHVFAAAADSGGGPDVRVYDASGR